MRCKKINITLGLILVLLYVPVTIETGVGDNDFRKCENKVKKWASFSIDPHVNDDKRALRDLLFFLHIPRTGGRTYFHCFLKKLYSSSQECPRSYDKLRFNPRKSNCRLLSTHDDYSMLSRLAKEQTSVVTILRHPVDRVFSTYEFSVEVAARFLIHPNLTSVARMTQRARQKTKGVSTLDIWPWKYLVPWMREDLFARRDGRRLRGQTYLVTNNSYDMEDIVMPLHEYINDPIALDIVHNGATFQIAGLTNNSYYREAHEVRHCVLKYNALGEHVLKVAKKRLDGMLYVGLTENHRESANMFGNIVGAQVISLHTKSSSNGNVAGKNVSEQSSKPNVKSNANGLVNNTYQMSNNDSSTEKGENLTVGKLMGAYESCISSLRNTQAERRVNSLKQIAPANFTKEARRRVPGELVREIMSLNNLDVELYNYAEHIFKKQQAHVSESSFYDESLGSTSALLTSSYPALGYSSLSWKFLWFFSIGGVLLLLITLYFLNSRGRRLKVKL